MKLNEKRIVEVVLIILFPAALFAGCAGNGNEKPEIINEAMVNETQVYESQVYEAQDNLSVYSGDQPSENEAVSLAVETTAITLAPVENEQGAVLERSVYFKTNQYTVQIEDETLLAYYASKLLSDPNASAHNTQANTINEVWRVGCGRYL